MKRIRNLGLAIALAAALSASVGAASAAAVSGFATGTYPATVSGVPQGKHSLTFLGLKYECSAPVINTQINGPSTQLVAQGFEGQTCDDGAGHVLPVKMNGCGFIFHPGVVSKGESVGSFDIGPAKCGPMTISFPALFCAYEISSQNGLKAKFVNKGEGSKATVDITAEAVINAVGNGGGCGKGSVELNWYGTWNVAAKDLAKKETSIKTAQLSGAYLTGEKGGITPKIEAYSYPQAIAGNGFTTFKFGADTVACEVSHLASTVSAAGTHLSMSGENSGCFAGGTLPTTVTMNSCQYTLDVENVGPPYKGGLGVGCTKAGDKIEFKVYLDKAKTILICTAKIGSQAAHYGVNLANVYKGVEADVAKTGISLNAIVKGVEYEKSGSCGSEVSTGTIEGETSLF